MDILQNVKPVFHRNSSVWLYTCILQTSLGSLARMNVWLSDPWCKCLTGSSSVIGLEICDQICFCWGCENIWCIACPEYKKSRIKAAQRSLCTFCACPITAGVTVSLGSWREQLPRFEKSTYCTVWFADFLHLFRVCWFALLFVFQLTHGMFVKCVWSPPLRVDSAIPALTLRCEQRCPRRHGRVVWSRDLVTWRSSCTCPWRLDLSEHALCCRQRGEGQWRGSSEYVSLFVHKQTERAVYCCVSWFMTQAFVSRDLKRCEGDL